MGNHVDILSQYGLLWYHIFFYLSRGSRVKTGKFAHFLLTSPQKKQKINLLTNRGKTDIIFKHLRECWNGRQARLRCVWLRRVGSSPISRTKKSRYPFGYLDFLCGGGTRKAVKKTCRWHVFRPWESPSGFGRIPEGCGQNQTTYPFGYLDFLCEGGTRKADQKTVRWTVFPPWESPSASRRIPA